MWLKESNRLKHFFYAIPTAVIGTILFTIGLAIGMEFKDKQYGNIFDWLDILATVLGGLLGQLIQFIIIIHIINLIK